MVVTPPAHLMGNEGGAYRYGSLTVGGVTNMYPEAGVLRPFITPAPSGAIKNLLGGTGAGSYDAMKNAANVLANAASGIFVEANGEFFNAGGTEGVMIKESFNTGAKTVTATNGLTAITFSASVAADPLTFAYAYGPNKPNPLMGDLIGITDGGVTHFYRLSVDPTNVGQIFPAYTGAGGAGLPFTIYRTGYGSISRIEDIGIPGSSVRLQYYVGGSFNYEDIGTGTVPMGTIEVIANGLHRMSPVLSPSGATLKATDIAFYKGFCLYAFGNSIGWSVAGFPTNVVVGFAATDFPDVNVSVINQTGAALTFEFVGDQLVAMFADSIWLVQATGSIPEFAFYKLSQTPGAVASLAVDPQVSGSNAARPSCSTQAIPYFLSRRGLLGLQGSEASPVDQSVSAYDFPATIGQAASGMTVTYDGSSWVTFSNQSGGRCLAFRDGLWIHLDFTTLDPNARGLNGLADGVIAGLGTSVSSRYQAPSISFWLPDGRVGKLADSLTPESTAASVLPWTWASPIANLGRVYPAWTFGGFEIWARAALTAVAPVNLNWSVYGGSDPYHMNLRQGPFAYDYATGWVDSRNRIGNTLDDTFFGIVLTGSSWIELTGVMLYPSDSQAAR